MKFKIFVAFLLVAFAAAEEELADQIVIEGSTIIPAEPPTVENGEVVSVALVTKPSSGRSSKAIIDDPQPTFCPYAGVTCPNGNDKVVTFTSEADCIRLCRANNCAYVTVTSSTCSLGGIPALGENPKPGDCGATAQSMPGNLTPTPGAKVLVRQFGIPNLAKSKPPVGMVPKCYGPSAPPPAECPECVCDGPCPAVVPKDDLSSHFCDVSGKYCPYTVGGEDHMHSTFTATVSQCKTQCVAFSDCFMAIYVDTGPFNKRMCHMLTKACKPEDMVDDANYVNSEGVPAKHASTTLFRLDMDTYRVAKKDFTDDAAFCPPGLNYYTKDNGPPYTNDFCLYPSSIQCPMADGNMYNQGQNKDEEQCLQQCIKYPTCGHVEWYQIQQFGGAITNRCNMKDKPICTENTLKSSKAPVSYIETINFSHAIPERVYPAFKTYVRMKKSHNGICPGIAVPDPSKVEWSAQFCIHYDRTCPAASISDRTSVDATGVVDCLTQCHHSEATCKSAEFDNISKKCIMINGQCTEDQRIEVLFAKYYYKIATGEDCPVILHCPDKHSSLQEGAACPNTCADPTASKTCEIKTKRCVCDLDYLENDGICVRKEDCPVDNCGTLGVNVPFPVAETEGTIVMRYQNLDELNEGDDCGEGATVQLSNPCPNTCASPTANADCAITEQAKSCHCSHADHFFDKAANLCVPASSCPA